MGTMASQITNITIGLLNRLFGCRSKKTSKLRVTGLCTGTGEFPAQMASNAENVSIWWRNHGSFLSPWKDFNCCRHLTFSKNDINEKKKKKTTKKTPKKQPKTKKNPTKQKNNQKTKENKNTFITQYNFLHV